MLEFNAHSIFLEGLNLLGREDHDLVSVDVGRRVRTTMRTYETLEDMMKEQSINGAQ